jgi:GT2 family glycosyltransferase
MNIPVLMLALNSLPLTKAAVASVLAQDVPVNLYVADNGSKDGTLEWLRAQPVNVIAFGENKGVSAAWNHGLKFLFDFLKNDAVLVVNNDVQLRKETARVLLEDGGEFVTAVSVDDPKALLNDWTPSKRPHPDFSCFLIRRSAWNRIGEFDARMASYASDGDYHLRLHQAGIEAYTIGLPFYHYASGTLKSARVEDKERIMKGAEADRQAFQKKWNVRMGSPEYYSLFNTSPANL